MDRSNIEKIAKTPEDRVLLAKIWDKINTGMRKNVPKKLGARCFLELKLQWRNIIWPICLCTALMKSL